MPIVSYPALYAGIRYCTYSLLGILGLNDTELIFTFFYSAPCCPENFNFASRITFDNHEFTCSWLQPKFLINIVMTVTISRFHGDKAFLSLVNTRPVSENANSSRD